MDIKLTILLACLVILGSAEKILRYMPTEYKLWSDNAILNFSFAMDEKVPYVNMTIKLLQDLKDVEVHVEGQITGKQDKGHYFNYNTTYNLCSFLAWKSASPIGVLLFSFLREFGNLPDSCPILKGEYKLHRVWFPEDPITSTFPEVDFSFNIQSFVTTMDGMHVNKMVINDFWKGEAVVKDVSSIKKSLLSMLPKIHAMG